MADQIQNNGNSRGIWDIGVIASLVILAFSIQSGNFNRSISTSPLTPINTAEIIDNPKEFIGKSITIRSKPIQRIGSSSFTVQEGQFLKKDPMLVINASGVPLNLPSDRNIEVQVVGQVRNFDITAIERSYNLKLNPRQYSSYVNQPVIVAQSISLAPIPGQVTQNPQQYYGKKITVTGEVKDIQSPVLMTLDKGQLIGGRDLPFFLTPDAKIAINKGQTIAVVGEVRPFVASEIERRYHMTWDEEVMQQLQAKYGNQPILIADAVYP